MAKRESDAVAAYAARKAKVHQHCTQAYDALKSTCDAQQRKIEQLEAEIKRYRTKPITVFA
jgi:hypothetical protein